MGEAGAEVEAEAGAEAEVEAEVEAEEMRLIEVTVGGQEEPSEESQDATAEEGQVSENA